MKLVKIFGIVMAAHGIAFMFIFAIPGCRSTTKKPTAIAPVAEMETPSTGVDASSPFMSSEPAEPVRFSPTRPGTPAAAQVVAQIAPASTTYTVVKGDSLWSIARKNGLTVKELVAANKIRADAPLKLGQKLVVPGKAPAPAAAAVTSARSTTSKPAAPAPSKTTITHVVKSGDTLGGIARKYHVKVGEIATANNIADPTKIRVGQSLKIPGWQAPTSKPASTAKTTPVAPVVAPALTEPSAPPLSPVFTAPAEPTVEPTPAPSMDNESPFVTPAPTTDAPIIPVEESGAPRIE